MFAAPWDMNGLIGMPGLLPVLGLGGLFGTSGGIRPGGPNAQLQASFASGAMSKAMSDVDDMSDDDMNDVEDQPTANVPVVSSVACHLAGQQAQSQRLPAIYSTRSMPWTPPAFAPMQPGMGMVHMDLGQQIQPNHLAYGHQDKPNLATPMGGYQGLGPSPEMPLPSTAPPPGMASALGGGLGLGMSPAPGLAPATVGVPEGLRGGMKFDRAAEENKTIVCDLSNRLASLDLVCNSLAADVRGLTTSGTQGAGEESAAAAAAADANRPERLVHRI